MRYSCCVRNFLSPCCHAGILFLVWFLPDSRWKFCLPPIGLSTKTLYSYECRSREVGLRFVSSTTRCRGYEVLHSNNVSLQRCTTRWRIISILNSSRGFLFARWTLHGIYGCGQMPTFVWSTLVRYHTTVSKRCCTKRVYGGGGGPLQCSSCDRLATGRLKEGPPLLYLTSQCRLFYTRIYLWWPFRSRNLLCTVV